MRNVKSRKVAFVARVYGHLEAFHLPFIKLLQGKGYEVHAYAGSDHTKENLQAFGVVCHDTSFYRGTFSAQNFKLVAVLTREFAKEQFALIHCNTPIAAFLARIAAKFARVPVVVYTAHGFHFSKGGPLAYWLIYYPLEYLAAFLTHYLITINLEDFASANNFPVRQKVIYVPGVGVDLSLFRFSETERISLRESYGINSKDFLIVQVAELNKNKNHIQLIESIEILAHRKFPVKCFLVGDGEYKITLEKEIEKRGLVDYIQFLGFRRDIPELLAACDLVTLLSKREGLPKALMEAMAAGKPIVATEVRGCLDLITHGHNGFLVPVGDISKTAQCITTLLLDANLRKQMALANLEQVKQYEIGSIIYKMDKFYSEALERTN